MHILCQCGKKKEVIPSRRERTKYCCKKCFYKYRPKTGFKKGHPPYDGCEKGWFKKGHTPWSKGKSIKKVEKVSEERSSLHKWIRRRWGKPKQCEKCFSTKNIEWANKTEQYLKVRTDWMQLCKKCHHRYDYINFKKRKVFYE